MTALGLDGWWEEPYYKLCYTGNLRGEFILAKLEQREPETFRTVMADIYREREPMPESITAFEWQTILADMGASPEEIADVQARMGQQ
jgi:hypothetical protein